MAEADLEMAKRHVAEGRGRIVRQRAILAQLTADGHDRAVHQARRLLTAMLETQRLAEAHAAKLEGQDD